MLETGKRESVVSIMYRGRRSHCKFAVMDGDARNSCSLQRQVTFVKNQGM